MNNTSGTPFVNAFWDYMKKQCMDCYELNKKRTIHKDWKSFHIKTCPKHTKQLQELREEMKKNPLPRLRRTKPNERQ